MKNYFLVLSFFLISLVTAVFVTTKLYPKEQNPSKIEQKLYNYIIQEYDSNDISYKALSTEITPLYDYTPFELDDCANELARMIIATEPPYNDSSLFVIDDFYNKLFKLYVLLYNVDNPDSIRVQHNWLITHTYMITPNDSASQPVTYTRTFYSGMDYDKLKEISNFKGDMLKRRDLIIEKIIERHLPNKPYKH